MKAFWVGSHIGSMSEIFACHPWKCLADLEQLKRNFKLVARDESLLLGVQLDYLSRSQAALFLKLRMAFPKLRLAVFASRIETLADLELLKDASVLLVTDSESKPKSLYQAWLIKGRVANRRSQRTAMLNEKSLALIESDFSGVKQQVQFVDFSNQGALVKTIEDGLDSLLRKTTSINQARFAAKEFVVFEYKDRDAKTIRVKSQVRWSQQIGANQFTYGLQFIGIL